MATQIRATTQVIKAEFEKKVKVIKAKGKANYTLLTKSAKAEAKKIRLQTESQTLQQIKETLQLVDDNLLDYQQYTAVSMMPNASVFFGFEESSGTILSGLGQPNMAPNPQDAPPRLLADAEADVEFPSVDGLAAQPDVFPKWGA